MKKLTNKLYGASLIALAFSLNAINANAQTCTSAPSCDTLGFTKSATDCDGHSILKCPFDQTKLYCDSGASGGLSDDDEAIAVGHIAYSDGTTSSVLKSGKTPIGVIVNVSGLAINLENLDNYNAEAKCSNYSVAGLNNWKAFTSAQLSTIKDNATTINDTLNKLSATALPRNIYYGSSTDTVVVNSSGSGYGTRCVIDISTINGTPYTSLKVGDIYYKDGVACGKIASLDSSGQHGVMVSLSTVLGNTKVAVTQNCNNKSTCGADWGIAECDNIKYTHPGLNDDAWIAGGCLDWIPMNHSYCDYQSNTSYCTTGYCQAAF